MTTGWLFTGLTQGLNLGLSSMAAIGAVIATVWATIAHRLGNGFDKRPTESRSSSIIHKVDEVDNL